MSFERIAPSDVLVTLTRDYETIVSAEDAPAVRPILWHAHFNRAGDVYARNRHHGLLQRFIVRPPLPWLVVDHVNGNPLDNRRWNLRACSHSQNMRNRRSQGFKGVTWTGYRFRARIVAPQGDERTLGYYPSAEDAARAYDAAALAFHGPFAWLNFPPQIVHSAALPVDIPF
jgi:hypothetical protein